MKRRTNWERLELPELVKLFTAIYKQQRRAIMGAFIQKGSLRLHPRMQHFLINSKKWMDMSQEQKEEKLKQFCMGYKGPKQVIYDKQNILGLPASVTKGGRKIGSKKPKEKTTSIPKSQRHGLKAKAQKYETSSSSKDEFSSDEDYRAG